MVVPILLLSMYYGFTDMITLNCSVFQRLNSSLRHILNITYYKYNNVHKNWQTITYLLAAPIYYMQVKVDEAAYLCYPVSVYPSGQRRLWWLCMMNWWWCYPVKCNVKDASAARQKMRVSIKGYYIMICNCSATDSAAATH